MAALTITAASVAWVSGPTEAGIGGEAIDAGQLVTGAGTSTDKYVLADADASAAPTGIALCKCYLDGGRLVIAKTGAVIVMGATLTVAAVYYAHPTAGSIGLETDLLSGDYVHKVCYGNTTANMTLAFDSAENTKP